MANLPLPGWLPDLLIAVSALLRIIARLLQP